MSDRSRLGNALLLSLLLHFAVFLASDLRLVSQDIPAQQEFLEVALVDMPPVAPPPAAVAPEPVAEAPSAVAALPESRIVPMPDAGVELPSDEARYLSDRDNVVPEESLRRGDSLDSGGPEAPDETVADAALEADDVEAEEVEAEEVRAEVAAQPAARDEPAEPAEPQPEPRAPVRDAPSAAPPDRSRPPPATDEGDRAIALADLMPRPGDLAAIPPRGEDPANRSDPARPARSNRDLLPGRRLRFSTGRGSAALLPNVRDGDVTLLNTKAHEFAPFVRRVATRVFQHLQIQLLDAARSQSAGSGEEHGLVRATMSADGRFLHATLVDARSDTRLSAPRVLLNVVGPRTFFDDNPPPGALADDGLIHFDLTIHLRVWSEQYPDGSGRRFTPTMFEGYFGTGLK